MKQPDPHDLFMDECRTVLAVFRCGDLPPHEAAHQISSFASRFNMRDTDRQPHREIAELAGQLEIPGWAERFPSEWGHLRHLVGA